MGVNYNKYIRACQYVTDNPHLFANFRRRHDYKWVMENVSQAAGLACLEEVEKDNPALLELISKFVKSDKIGHPAVFNYVKHEVKISPTTARYIKILSDLIKMFGTLNKMNIVEIGCGYGGQCKIIYDYFKPKSYTLIDLPEALLVAERFLRFFRVNPNFRQMDDESEIKYDLCISNYAFSELDRQYQDFYNEKIVKHSARGFMIFNFIGQRGESDAMTLDELLSIKDNYKTFPEVPVTGSNLVYTWNINHK